jgi:sugar lactone lactonase YvrE
MKTQTAHKMKTSRKLKKGKEQTMKLESIRSLSTVGIVAVLVLALTSPIRAQGDEATFPSFIPFEGQPEGVAVDKLGNVFASVRASSDQVWRFSSAGEKTLLADLGEPGGGAGGLVVDASGNVYLARAMANQGVYRITPDGEVALLPGTEQIVFPNGLAFDLRESLYVTETFSGDISSGSFGQGGIWRIAKDGAAELWLRDELLTGLPPSLFPFPVGANGIGFCHGALYVINTDKGLVVRVPVRTDGSPGQPKVWKQVEDVPESPLYNSSSFPVLLDGLAFDIQGNVYITVISRSAIVRINADDRSQETVAVHPEIPLDSPASLAFATDMGEWESLFVTNLGMFKDFIPDQPWPGPGLVKIDLQRRLGLEWSPIGTWIVTVPTTMGNIVMTHSIHAQDSTGRHYGGTVKQYNTNPTLFGTFPEWEAGGDIWAAQTVRTGPDSFETTLMYHTIKKGEGPVAETAGVGICNATWRLTGPNTNEGESTLAVYLAEQDADGDGFPDEGEEPAVCMEFTYTSRRLTMMSDCIPTP